jgi:UDP-N-acetylmuramoylalanine--D-glutamate ligase
VVDGWIVADGVERLDAAVASTPIGEDGRIMPVADLRVPGAHNLSNALAAIAVGLLFGIPVEAIAAAAASFTGVEHRLETVAIVDGVRFVNDSQGTQPDAVIAALRAFDRPIVLIAGGRDKDVDLSDLPPVVADRAVAAVVIGESGPELGRRFRSAGLPTVEGAGSMDEAVDRADALARMSLAHASASAAGSIATVLLSPAAASFDMFKDYEDRGLAFKAAVERLAARRREADR